MEERRPKVWGLRMKQKKREIKEKTKENEISNHMEAKEKETEWCECLYGENIKSNNICERIKEMIGTKDNDEDTDSNGMEKVRMDKEKEKEKEQIQEEKKPRIIQYKKPKKQHIFLAFFE